MQHTARAGGPKCMEVDHFNPNRKRDSIQNYSNLYPATRHCNGAKRDRWPKGKDRAAGMRFLDCCKEADFGLHIFEDPDTHELVGVTPPGKYHVRACDLNAPHLVNERRQRAEALRFLSSPLKIKMTKDWDLPEPAAQLQEFVREMIPPIPYLTGPELEKQRQRRAAMAAALQ